MRFTALGAAAASAILTRGRLGVSCDPSRGLLEARRFAMSPAPTDDVRPAAIRLRAWARPTTAPGLSLGRLPPVEELVDIWRGVPDDHVTRSAGARTRGMIPRPHLAGRCSARCSIQRQRHTRDGQSIACIAPTVRGLRQGGSVSQSCSVTQPCVRGTVARCSARARAPGSDSVRQSSSWCRWEPAAELYLDLGFDLVTRICRLGVPADARARCRCRLVADRVGGRGSSWAGRQTVDDVSSGVSVAQRSRFGSTVTSGETPRPRRGWNVRDRRPFWYTAGRRQRCPCRRT